MPQRGHGSPSRPCTLGNLLVSSALWRRAEPAYVAVYNNFLKLEIFNRFAHLPGITGLMERLIGEVVFPHPTNMGRIVFPQNTANGTPPHQDYVHIHGATATYTCWMSLGDCPTQLGGLTIQVGSHRHGVFDYHVARAERDITGWGYGRTTGLGGRQPAGGGPAATRESPVGVPRVAELLRSSASYVEQPGRVAAHNQGLLLVREDFGVAYIVQRLLIGAP